ncbi:uncharacterized protein LOC107370839 [Tetranychus urticae]|uniref:uncharacterized protein LOC107370839 n=1 Tax=Tetranychus urticae TaxID=32264 RepID=UPI000D656E1B|nr:uncharacterized protein LOC107370839 [Tetranychus urticae]
MLLKLLIVFTLLYPISTIPTISLVNLPLKMPKGSSVINATLTDVNGYKIYFIQELISASGPTIKSKILISGNEDSYSVHYNADSYTGVDSKERLFIQGTNCLLLTYNISWDKTLLDLIFLMGPSILYRLDHSSFVWKSVADKNIRGIMMKGASAKINENLQITFYYKSHLDYQSGIESPSRIEFSGYHPTSRPDKEILILYIDIYSIQHVDAYIENEIYQDLVQNKVQPPTGIGCPHYLSGNKRFPKLQVSHLHFTMDERVQGSTTHRSLSKVNVANLYDFLRIKTSLVGSASEVIYDYRLGVSFTVGTNGSVAVASIDSNTPGFDRGLFSLQNLLMLNDNFKYVGRLDLEHRFGLPVEAWESVQLNVNINGKKVDKAVITQFFVSSHNDDVFRGYTLVSTKISIYDYDQSKKVYTLTEGITRDFMSFQEAQSIESIRSLTEKVNFASSDEKLILNFILECAAPVPANTVCIKHTEERIYWLKRDFLYYILLTKPVSLLRIADIQYRFTDTKIEMEVKFLDLPHLEFIFNSKTMYLSEETFDKMMKTRANNEPECLEKLSRYQQIIKVAIYRPSDSVCGYLSNPDDLKEDTKHGQSCSVYLFPMNNLRRVKEELTLDQIHDAFLRYVGVNFVVDDGDSPMRFKISDVIDVTKKETGSNDDIASRIRHNAKLKIDYQFTLSVPDAKTFADCYRNCHESDQVPCITFSFCNTDGVIDCRVSSLQASDVASLDQSIETDLKCEIYSISVLDNYSKKSNRKFKTQQSTAVEQDSVHSCAKACHVSSDCISFQYCDGSCTLGDFLYTDEATQYDEECMIYTPKVSKRYQKTGNQIVSDVMITKSQLTLDQCASLCYELSDGEETGCKSFNYCPKSRTESSCSLTHFSVKSPYTKTTDGVYCSNYELKVESNGKKRKESSSTEVIAGTSGSSAFGIIMLFLFVGASLGFIAPFAYSKVKHMHDASKTNEDFTRERQQNEQQDETT